MILRLPQSGYFTEHTSFYTDRPDDPNTPAIVNMGRDRDSHVAWIAEQVAALGRSCHNDTVHTFTLVHRDEAGADTRYEGVTVECPR